MYWGQDVGSQGGDSLRIIFKEISSKRASSQRQAVARRKKGGILLAAEIEGVIIKGKGNFSQMFLEGIFSKKHQSAP